MSVNPLWVLRALLYKLRELLFVGGQVKADTILDLKTLQAKIYDSETPAFYFYFMFVLKQKMTINVKHLFGFIFWEEGCASDDGHPHSQCGKIMGNWSRT